MRIVCVLLSVVLVACTVKTEEASPAARLASLRDAEGFAIASCLSYQAPAYLKDQGDAWASVIVQRTKGNLDALLNIAGQVKREDSKREMAWMRDEAKPGQDKALPILYCMEIIDKPVVRTAIEQAVQQAQQ